MSTTVAASLIFAMAVCLLWMCTGVSPFLWISRVSLHCEAVRLQLASCIAVAFRYFRTEYAGTLAMVRALEVGQAEPKQARARAVSIRKDAAL